jgi:hypothetical protein
LTATRSFDRTVQERLDPVVDLFAQAADLALGDAARAHGLDQIVHPAGRNALRSVSREVRRNPL